MEVCLTIDDAAEKIVMERGSAPTGLTVPMTSGLCRDQGEERTMSPEELLPPEQPQDANLDVPIQESPVPQIGMVMHQLRQSNLNWH